MSLAKAYLVNNGQTKDLFKEIQQGQAPKKFTIQHLKDIGLTSSNWRAAIPLLKAIGFLTVDGTPTEKYHSYRDSSQARKVLGEALKQAYSDLFVIRTSPKRSDAAVIQGKFKSTFNTSDNIAGLMANTFFALLDLADFANVSVKQEHAAKAEPQPEPTKEHPSSAKEPLKIPATTKVGAVDFRYNIEIHLPATKDIEVFNAIFRSLKDHLID